MITRVPVRTLFKIRHSSILTSFAATCPHTPDGLRQGISSILQMLSHFQDPNRVVAELQLAVWA